MHLAFRRVALVLAVMLALAVVPAGAFATAKPAVAPAYVVEKDEFESDDTSAEALVFGEDVGEVSSHTLTEADQDWVVFSAEATGEPWVIETQAAPEGLGTCWFDGTLAVWSDDTTDPAGLALVQENDDSQLWTSRGSSLYFVAPAPGTYYVQVASDNPYDNGGYTLFMSQGISRRIGGTDRFDTAAKLADTMYPDVLNAVPQYVASLPFRSTRAVILVNGASFPDALAAGAWGASLAGKYGVVPVLLTTQGVTPFSTVSEVQKLAYAAYSAGVKFTVFVVGGPASVGEAQVEGLERMPFVKDVVRVSGDNRFATAAAVADMVIEGPYSLPKTLVDPQIELGTTAVLVNGYKWPDGVAAGTVCGSMRAPLLLSAATTLTAPTRSWLTSHSAEIQQVLVLGDTSSISTGVVDSLASINASFTVERIAGANRYQTAYEIARWGADRGWLDPSGIMLVTGEAFPDGLAAAPIATLNDRFFGPMPILLTKRSALSTEVARFRQENGPSTHPSYVIGSAAAVSADTKAAFDALWSAPEK